MYWVQEEPENMGAWQYIATRRSGIQFELVSRPASASPATGFKHVHLAEQKAIIDAAFTLK
jgi:2-oxoglutarate dehydrogenase E1 component